LILIVAAGWRAFHVYEGQRGIVLRFGKLADTTQPDRAGTCPLIEKGIVNPTQVRRWRWHHNVKSKVEKLMPTDDENIVDVQSACYNRRVRPTICSTIASDDLPQAAET
jgi:membrane protease subunit HflK